MKLNDFKTDLEYSLEQNESDNFDNFYRRVFGEVKIENVEDLSLQFKGVDKILTFPSGKQILIDEKKRREVYDDILLEIWSNTEKKTPGWVFKSFTDYIMYAFMPNKKCYLLPSLILKLWVKENLKNFEIYFSKIEAQNIGYVTTSYAIPITILLEGLKNVMQKEF